MLTGPRLLYVCLRLETASLTRKLFGLGDVHGGESVVFRYQSLARRMLEIHCDNTVEPLRFPFKVAGRTWTTYLHKFRVPSTKEKYSHSETLTWVRTLFNSQIKNQIMRITASSALFLFRDCLGDKTCITLFRPNILKA
jgi:hypothetical protein